MNPRTAAYARIGEWPAGVGREDGLARQHAAGVWDTARSGVVVRAGALWALVDRDPGAFGGQVDLALLGTLAGHLRRCGDCWLTWIDGEMPAVLLSEAVRRRKAGDVFRPLLREIRASAGRSGRGKGI